MIISAFISGLIMAAGLTISGMIYPSKVIGFLDVFGQFDPTLMFVMIGALVVAGIGFKLLEAMPKPVLCNAFDCPKKTALDVPLILGAIIFGVGWGLIGFCPGPAIVGVGLGLPQAFYFTAAMLVGMFIAKQTERK